MTTTAPDANPSTDDAHSRPAPDNDSAPFWAALADRRVIAQRCRACEAQFLPPMPGCPYCGDDAADFTEIPGTGSIYSFVTVHVALTPADEGHVPYSIATVDLDGGGRAYGRLEGDTAARIDARVAPVFVDHADWTELRFTIEEET